MEEQSLTWAESVFLMMTSNEKICHDSYLLVYWFWCRQDKIIKCKMNDHGIDPSNHAIGSNKKGFKIYQRPKRIVEKRVSMMISTDSYVKLMDSSYLKDEKIVHLKGITNMTSPSCNLDHEITVLLKIEETQED